MKKIIYIFTLVFLILISSEKIKAYDPNIYDSMGGFKINEDGTLDITRYSTNASEDISDFYKYENNTLHIYQNPDTNYFWYILVNHDTNIILSDNVNLGVIFLNANLTISSENENSEYRIEKIEGMNDNVKLSINNSDMSFVHINGINDTIINNSKIKGEYFRTTIGYGATPDQSKPRRDYYEKYGFYPYTSLHIYDSELSIKDIMIVGEEFKAENSIININQHFEPHTEKMYVTNSEFNGIGNYAEFSFYNINAIFDNSFIKNFYVLQSVTNNSYNDGYTKLSNDKFYKFNNCIIEAKKIRAMGFILNNTNVKATEESEIDYIKANNDSYIEIPSIRIAQYIYLEDSKIKATGGASFIQIFPSNINSSNTNDLDFYNENFKYDLTLINSSIETNVDDWYISSFYIENSTANFSKIDTTYYNEYPINDTDLNKKSIIKNSSININKIIARYDLDFINSKVEIGNFESRDHFELDRLPILSLDNTDMLVNGTDSDIGLNIYDLEFYKSHLISKGIINAWESNIDITTHNLLGINEAKSVMPMRLNGNIYSFYDNNEISKYVEIKTPLKVTFKIKNGTWKDGTTEDKIVESYYFGSINEVDIPKEMIPSDGYENGSWDKEIIYDNLKDEYIYTYTFKTKEEIKKEETKKKETKNKEEKEEKKVEVKKLKNPNTGAFLSLTTIGILTLICLKILKYTKKIKYFNKL